MSSRLTIDIARYIAIERGGQCLSTEYINGTEPMLWMCAKGHQWKACLSKVKNRKQWCGVCVGNKKFTIELAKQIAIERGGQCLSTEYVNCNTKLLWQCAELHVWEARLSDIKNKGTWCGVCAGKKKFTIEVPKQIAIERGGQCLSTEYVNCYGKLLWQCAELHIWEACLHDVKNGGTWCPTCAKRPPLTIQDAYNAAAEKGGYCLSTSYINISDYLMWRCANGHVWEATLNKVRNADTWCAACAGVKKFDLDFARAVAVERGGQCLSTEYINCETNMLWQCAEMHTWYATLTNIKNNNSWCPSCSINSKWTIQELDEIAIKNGGRCLSTIYVNYKTHLKWMCEKEHIWEATPHSVTQGSWCPRCNISRGERSIERWLTDHNIVFVPQFSFPGSRYSYDFYIPSTGWIIEFDGIQHFIHNDMFHKKYSLEHRQNIDKEKIVQSYTNGLSMLRIHYKDFDIIGDLLQIILNKSYPHIRCSRTEDYDFLGLNYNITPKHLTLNIVK